MRDIYINMINVEINYMYNVPFSVNFNNHLGLQKQITMTHDTIKHKTYYDLCPIGKS